ncbi:MAG: hypothetical protein K0Q79_2761 [Flavipsychrobacter sp.]|nr:hypothetical protein [Flavipsychrobacter sp.]
MVAPISEEKLIALITEAVPPKEGVTYRTSADGLVANVIVDSECCYGIMSKVFIDGKVQYATQFGVCERKDNSMSLAPSFYFPISLEALQAISLPEISLKEFMGSRYDYNSRVRGNMKEFLEDVGSQIPLETEIA